MPDAATDVVRFVVAFVFDEFNVREWKMSGFALQFTFPLAVYVRFGHQYDVAHL